jgi:hypothetical protein
MTTAIASADARTPPHRIPDPESCDDQPDLLLRRHRQDGEHGEGHQAVLVQVPEGEEQKRAGEGDRVELVQRQPLGRRVEQVDERKPEPGAVAAEVLPCEPEHRQRTEGDDDRLDDQQHLRARPDPPQRREGGEDRIEVCGQARDLHSVPACHLQEMAVGGVPDRLHHVAQVVTAGGVRAMAQHGERREAGCIGCHRRPDERLRNGMRNRLKPVIHVVITDAIRSRQRAPSTSSLARSR